MVLTEVVNVAIKGSYYNTQWKDRNLTRNVESGQGDSGDTDIIYLKGVNQSHTGVEVEAKVALHEMVDVDFAFSKGIGSSMEMPKVTT